jgi:CRISPR-associated protein Cas2
MCGFGDRLQYSVFECRLSAADLARCKHALGKLIHNREDQVLFVELGPAVGRGERVITALGRPYAAIDAPCIIVDRDETVGAARGTRRSDEAVRRVRRRLAGAHADEADEADEA